MSDIIKFTDGDKQLLLFVYEGRVATISTELMEFEGYANTRKSWFDAKEREEFEYGIEYKTLQGEELRKFKEDYGNIIIEDVTTGVTSTIYDKYKIIQKNFEKISLIIPYYFFF